MLGKTFGARGVAALSGVDEESVAPALERLVRKELLTIDADPRSPERGQYGFLQALVQRVAYETLAKRERGRLHRAAASYLEHDAGIDADEIAEVIAAHHRDAFEADPNGPDAAASRLAAGSWLERAGERAASLGAPEDGQRAFDDAAAIAEEPAERARLLERAGKLAEQANRLDEAEERLRASAEIFTEIGDTHAAARAASSLGLTLWRLNRRTRRSRRCDPPSRRSPTRSTTSTWAGSRPRSPGSSTSPGSRRARMSASSSHWTWPRSTVTWPSCPRP